LWPRELRVGVFPDRVTLLPARRRLSWNGLSRVVDEPHGVSCDGATEESPWHAALQALEVALPEFSGHRTAATVILSNHFMRYTLLPWSDKLSSAEEELAFARHCFTRIYGPHAESWALRLSPESGTAPRLASAVDVELIDGLRGVFGAAGIPLKSIQPHLMAAYNSFRGGLGRHDAWLAVLEQGNLCLALLRRARTALDRRDAHTALSLAKQHAARFPRGTLRQERMATQILALCGLQRTEEARVLARELERVAPRSPHLMQIRASCVTEEGSDEVR